MNNYLYEKGFDVETTDVLIDNLLSVMEGVYDNERYGICWNWDVATYALGMNIDCYEIVNKLAVGWPNHTGNEAHPIEQREHASTSLWAGTQLLARQGLMAYMLRQLVDYRRTIC
jgi:hypothetical protein